MKARQMLVLLLMLSIVPLLSGCGINTSPGTGEKVGQIVKLNKQGLIRDTWEGQLIRGGMNNGSGSFGMVPFEFTVDDDSILQKVKDALDKQTEVKIKYRMEGLYSLFRTDSSGHFITGIEPVLNKK